MNNPWGIDHPGPREGRTEDDQSFEDGPSTNDGDATTCAFSDFMGCHSHWMNLV
jgi:hypothetical protein